MHIHPHSRYICPSLSAKSGHENKSVPLWKSFSFQNHDNNVSGYRREQCSEHTQMRPITSSKLREFIQKLEDQGTSYFGLWDIFWWVRGQISSPTWSLLLELTTPGFFFFFRGLGDVSVGECPLEEWVGLDTFLFCGTSGRSADPVGSGTGSRQSNYYNNWTEIPWQILTKTPLTGSVAFHGQ